MMSSTVISAVNPPIFPSSSRAICPSDFPFRRMEQNSTTKSCTARRAPQPITIHKALGKLAELCGQRRSDQRPRPGGIAAK